MEAFNGTECNSRTSCNSFARSGVPWAEMLNGEEVSGVLGVPGIESFAPSPYTRVVFVSPSVQMSEVVGVLSKLDFVQDLEVTFLGETRVLHAFPRLGSLQSLALKNVSMGDGLLNWVVANTALQRLALRDVKYNGSFRRLATLKNLRKLEIGGSVPELSRDCAFLTSLAALTSVALELNNPNESALTSLIECSAAIALKLSEAVDPIVMSKLSSVPNLKKLEFSNIHKLELPRSFRGLRSLQEISFRNLPISLNEVRGLGNIPTSVSSLCFDNDSSYRLQLAMIAAHVKNQITHLSLKVPIIGLKLGLNQFPVLESLELYPKKEIDEGVFRELRDCRRLSHVGIGGSYLDVEKALEEHFCGLELRSLDISNAMITSKALAEINKQSNLKKLTFRGSLFDSFNWSSVRLPRSVESLSFDCCFPIEKDVVRILSSPTVRNLRSIYFTLSDALSQDKWTEVRSKQRELSAVVSIYWMLSEVD